MSAICRGYHPLSLGIGNIQSMMLLVLFVFLVSSSLNHNNNNNNNNNNVLFVSSFTPVVRLLSNQNQLQYQSKYRIVHDSNQIRVPVVQNVGPHLQMQMNQDDSVKKATTSSSSSSSSSTTTSTAGTNKSKGGGGRGGGFGSKSSSSSSSSSSGSKAAATLKKKGSSSSSMFPYTGTVVPGTISPPRLVVDETIVKPDYWKTGIPIKTGKKMLPWMIEVKTSQEIEKMRLAGILARQVLDAAGKLVKPGVTTDEIDSFVHDMIVQVRTNYITHKPTSFT
jgi:hypothetical protein